MVSNLPFLNYKIGDYHLSSSIELLSWQLKRKIIFKKVKPKMDTRKDRCYELRKRNSKFLLVVIVGCSNQARWPKIAKTCDKSYAESAAAFELRLCICSVSEFREVTVFALDWFRFVLSCITALSYELNPFCYCKIRLLFSIFTVVTLGF